MNPLDDAYSLWMMGSLEDASFGLCVPWKMRPLDDASLGRRVVLFETMTLPLVLSGTSSNRGTEGKKGKRAKVAPTLTVIAGRRAGLE
jgi:hypothetical protein